MRDKSARYAAKVGYLNQWTTQVFWSNDGWRTETAATYVSGTVTASLLLQTHWTCDLELADVEIGEDGVNGFSTQIRIMHGMVGERPHAMGVYKVNTASWSSDAGGRIKVTGSSYEWYIQAARFVNSREFKAQSASVLTKTLLREVIPGVQLSWECDDMALPRLIEERDRWGLIDGRQDSPSIARALGAYIFAGPAGGFVARPVPRLDDEPVWEADEGVGGVLLNHGESFTDEGVYNTVVFVGEQPTVDNPLQAALTTRYRPGIAQDLDPDSLTYAKRPVTQGGFGVKPRFYVSQLLVSHENAQKAAEAALAPLLGQRVQVQFTQLHDPSLEPGDVGIVHGRKGDRRVILDEITYDLTGAPLSCQTRTTATTLIGDDYTPPVEDESLSAD